MVNNCVKEKLSESFQIAHATIELECETCEDLGPACDMDLVMNTDRPTNSRGD